ncbi:GTP-binding protein [Moelleriella libera RCEF 2490]|uniref:GTP-binding protein n=1 Tax=Moelleriella libera RCEF 2490 TaxID=1081109 RepID=A0A167X5I2_9HYPO|nr:GTP-binding protein [Moelleriella libera RCEF 2490]
MAMELIGPVLKFMPRTSFAFPNSIPKTYFLGHHKSGVGKMRTMLPNVSLVLECRDYRLPLSTQNPMLESALRGRERLVIYTKCDLGEDSAEAQEALRKMHHGHGHGYDAGNALFWSRTDAKSTTALLARLRQMAARHEALTGLRALVVGMPNVGKSTLLNKLRAIGTPEKTSKAARTGNQAGVTRKVSTAVRVVPPAEEQGGAGDGVFMIDTPGVFMPYVQDGETMLKVALVSGVKAGLVADKILVDYLLYRMNLWNPHVYYQFCQPTNDVDELLDAVVKRRGLLKNRGCANLPKAATWFLESWRTGKLGRFVLDDLSQESISAHQHSISQPPSSFNQARKAQRIRHKKKLAGV